MKKTLLLLRPDLGMILIIITACLIIWDWDNLKKINPLPISCTQIEMVNGTLGSNQQDVQEKIKQIEHWRSLGSQFENLIDTLDAQNLAFHFNKQFETVKFLSSKCFLLSKEFNENYFQKMNLDSLAIEHHIQNLRLQANQRNEKQNLIESFK